MGYVVDDFLGKLGSLDTGSAPASMRSDRLPYKRNIEHIRTGSVGKRPGRRPLARVAPYPENTIAAPLTNLGATAGSTLTTGTLYAWITYSTSTGETDDVHSTVASVGVTSGDGVAVKVPFHIMGRKVARHDVATGAIVLSDYFNTNTLTGFANNTFAGYYVYCRDPSIQDETRLGLNPQNYKTWDRLNYIGKIATFTASTWTFTMDRTFPVSLDGKIIDIMMPDRNGHAVRAANIYVSQSPTGTRYIHSSVNPTEPTTVTVTAIPTSNRVSPATRITRTAPTVTAITTTDTDPVSGITSNRATDFQGAEYLARYAHETADPAVLDNGQWPELASFLLAPRPRTLTQMAWPSLASRVSLLDGQGIRINAGTKPSRVETTSFYLQRVTPSDTKTVAALTNPSSTHRIYRYSGSATAALTASPATFRASYGTEVTTVQYGYLGSAGTFYGGDVANAVNKLQVEWKQEPADSAYNSSTCLVFRLTGAMGNVYTAVTAPKVKVKRWNAAGAAWVDVKTDIDPTDITSRLIRLCVDYAVADNEGGRHVWSIEGQDGACFTICALTEEANRTNLASDPAVTTSDVLVEQSDGVTVDVKSAPLSSNESESCIPNTTGQWPLVVEPAYVGTNFGRPQDNVTTLAASADSIFVLDGTTFSRVYQHERRNGVTDKNTLEVCAAPWQFGCVPGGRAYFCNELNTMGWNLRFDGVQTWPHGVDPPNGTAIIPPATGDTPPKPDPTPATDPGMFVLEQQQWRPNPTTGLAERLPGSRGRVNIAPWAHGGGQLDTALDWRWRVRDSAGGVHYIYDYRSIHTPGVFTLTFGNLMSRMGAMSGRVFEGMPSPSGWFPTETKTTYTDDIVKYLAAGLIRTAEQIAADAGAASAVDADSADVDPGVKDYYVITERRLDTEGRSYVAISEPRKLTTVEVVPKPPVTVTNADGTTTTTQPTGTKVVLHAPPPSEPQATHIRIARNLTDSAAVYRVVMRLPLLSTLLDANGNITVDDLLADEDLGVDVDFETGTPPACSRIAFQGNKLWCVPLYDTGSVAQSRPYDPESFSPFDVAAPNFVKPCSISALAPVGEHVLAHGDNGVAISIGGTTGALGVDPMRFQALQCAEGAIGPRAWLNADNVHLYVTRSGVQGLFGTEPRKLSDMLDGTFQTMTFTNASALLMSCAVYQDEGKHQAWFTYSTRPDGRPDRVLVFDLDVGPGFEESRRLWSDWTEFYASGVCRTERKDGSEMNLVSDHWGQAYIFGGTHDAGMHIDAEFRTKPLTKLPAPSFTPRWLVAKIAGITGAFLNFDFLKDGTGSRANERLQRFILRSPTGDSAWGTARWGAFNWGESRATGFDDYSAGLGTPFTSMQVVISQKWDDQPPGTPRTQNFEMAGFVIESETNALRKVG